MPKLDPGQIPSISGTGYPAPHADKVKGRSWQRLGDAGGLTQFAANRVTLKPGAWSSQRHWHRVEDEFVMMISGQAILIDDQGEHVMLPGDCAAFKAGDRNGHHLVNRSTSEVVFLVIGKSDPTDSGEYPDIDMKFLSEAEGGGFARKDGSRY